MSNAQFSTSKPHNKRILILGGSAGLGLAVAKACIETGAHVTISSSRPVRTESAVNEILNIYPSASNRIEGYACDVSTTNVERKIETLVENVEKLDHIVYTAGDSLPTMPLKEVTLEKVQSSGQKRASSALLAAKIGSKYLTRSNTCSITFSTGSAMERPMPGGWSTLVFFAAGFTGMTHPLAFDPAPIRVNIVAPGVVGNTNLWGGMPKKLREQFMRSYAEMVPTGQTGKVEDVAEACLYFLRDANVTGSVLDRNSGGFLV